MDLNLLKFKTKKGTRLLFDNYTGIVIEEKDYTEYLLEHIDEDKDDIINKLVELGIYNEEKFEADYKYIVSLFDNGYFYNNMTDSINDFSEESIFKGISSHLILITTEECNLRCKYCVYSECYADKKTYSSKVMKKETAFKAIDLFKQIHEEKVMRGYKNQPKINFYGGEPLLNFNVIKDVIQYVNDIGFENVEYLITTNGTVMNDEIIDFLAKNNFLVSFSLDGDKFNHNRNRVSINGLNTHDRIIKNIIKYNDKLKYYKRDTLINITCCFDNYTDMEKVTSFFEKLRNKVENLNIIYNKIYEIDTTYYSFCKDRYKNNIYNIDENTYINSVKILFDKHYKGNKLGDIPKSIKAIFTSYYLIKNRKKGIIDFHQGNACIIGDKICISPDEKIYICEKANQEMDIGNLSKGLDYNKINNLYKEYFKIRDKYCLKCPINRLCDVCYVHFIKNNSLQYNERFCQKRQEVFKRGLEVVYSLLEEDKEIFN